jgi:hypothetical protein
VLLLQIALSAAAAYLVYRLGSFVLDKYARGREIAALAAAVWFVHPLTVKNTQNCLETGAYTLLVLLSVFFVARKQQLAIWSAMQCVIIGALLGLAFWARNDAAFLILGVCVIRAASGWRVGRLSRRTGEAVAVGAVSVVVALPWLIHNQVQFGSVMPISGQAESAHIALAHNLHRIPVALTEHFLLLMPIPNALEQHPLTVAVCTMMVAGLAVGLWRLHRACEPRVQLLLALAGTYGLGLILFYGVFFGAGHFVDRYLFPLSPFLALVWAGSVMLLIDWIKTHAGRTAGIAAPVCLVVLAGALNVRLYRQGDRHAHFPVVNWVRANVPDDVWCGAIQSGTLGFFHDRTINLDGKVNPEALHARLNDEIPRYVLDKGIVYIADWARTAVLMDRPLLKDHFDLIVRDERRNLMVMKRRDLDFALVAGRPRPQ